MNKKCKQTIKITDNVYCKYPFKKNLHWEESEGEDLTVEEVIYCVIEVFEGIDALLFHALAIFLRK